MTGGLLFRPTSPFPARASAPRASAPIPGLLLAKSVLYLLTSLLQVALCLVGLALGTELIVAAEGAGRLLQLPPWPVGRSSWPCLLLPWLVPPWELSRTFCRALGASHPWAGRVSATPAMATENSATDHDGPWRPPVTTSGTGRRRAGTVMPRQTCHEGLAVRRNSGCAGSHSLASALL